ncbi:MAG: transcription termination factor NusA [Candidatus Aceula lacicola]|nr:transcription termination factor NusA [Candidatus Aceula lacicola]
MESELLVILDQIERDKGINKEILIEAVETAVASAARKVWTIDKEQEIQVVLDRLTGKLTAYADGEEIKSRDFGRIAAQTAKQVVIQKIREAEKDVIYSEYYARIGQLVNGSVYRIDKGNIIVDLAKTEGFIPRSEQSSKEEFKQGDRIRAYVLDVRRESKGPQIVLSRSHPNLVKRLFELEVPEIYDGIVEVKAIARDAGERTKIAVHSKEERVDCVGACVGMRGSRVKSIVTELHGEKIDIVRHAEDRRTYIQAALSPAEIVEMHLNAEEKRADIVVPDDQLSIAIGKHGQNIRLAGQLLGWQLEVFSEEQWKEHSGKLPEKATESMVKDKGPSVADLSGVGDKVIMALNENKLSTLEQIAKSSVEDLSQIKGLGKVKAEKMIKEAKKLIKQKKKKG